MSQKTNVFYCRWAAISVCLLLMPLQILAIPSDPLYGNQWGVDLVMKNPADPTKTVWDIPNADGNGVTIYVVDSGVSPHGDLSFADAGGDSEAGNGHGTAVYGILAANHNAIGIAGMAPGASVISRKTPVVFNDTVTALNNLIALATPANYIVQLSREFLPNALNANNICPVVNNVINNGALVVAATGNMITADASIWLPAACNSNAAVSVANRQHILSVGNSQVGDTRNAISRYSPDHDLFAPGTNIRSTTRTGGYTDFTGTSYAAPIVSGASAILMGCGMAPANIETALEASGPAIAFPGGSAPRINVYTALENANTAPSALNLQNYNMPPNNIPLNQTLPSGTVVPVGGLAIGQLLATDSDTCDSHTYEVVAADPELSLLDHDADGVVDDIVLAEGTYNTATTFSITVRARDFFGELSANIVITVEIEAPVGPTPPILDVVLVMDRSGSMGWASAGVGTRMDVLQTATNAFADYLNMLSDNIRLGFIQFNATADEVPPAPAAEIFPFQVLVDDPDLSIANIDEAHAAINSLMPVGGTNIVEGVQDAAAILNPLADPSPRQAIVLLTDGLHNVPTPLDETTPTTLSSELTSAIASPSTVFYSMGLGTAATINSDSLSTTALAQSGVHLDEPDPPSMAMKLTWFANEIVEGAMVFDPIIELKLNELGKLDVPVTYADSSVRFAIFWTYANAENIVTRINTPSGACVIENEDSGAQFAQAKGKKYRIINVDLPFICKGKLEHGGVWSVDMLASSGSTSGPVLTHTGTTTSTSERFEQERFAVSAYTTSDVKLAAEGSSKHKYVNFDAALSGIAGSELKDVKYTAYIKPPIDSNKLVKGDDDLSLEQQVQQQQILRDLLAQQKTIVVDMKSDTANVASASILAKQTGIYQVRIVMEGIDKAGFTYRREANTSIYHDYKSNKLRYIIICILLILLLLISIRLFISWRAKAAYKL